MKQYLDLLKHILTNGPEKSDRTGTGTKSVFGYQMRFDLSEGFPLVTTKHTFMKAITAELLWFIEGSTDERRLAEIQYGKDRKYITDKTTIWTDNANAQGKALGHTNTDTIKLLGPIYGHGWRRTASLNATTLIEMKKIVFFETIPKIVIDESEIIPNDAFVGKYLTNQYGNQYKVIKKINTPKNSSYEIQSIDTGHKEIVTIQNLKNNSFGQKILYGRFYSTVKKDKKISYYKKAYDMWYNMISKCYNTYYKSYNLYGGKGIFVDSRWYNFETFLHDIESLPFFYDWVNGIDNSINEWCLDTEYFNTNKYSKHTCIFLPSKINKSYSNHLIDFTKKNVVEFQNGNKFEYIFFSDLDDKFPDNKFVNNLKCLDEEQELHKTCKFYTVTATKGYEFRKKIIIDQLEEVIKTIKTNPDSRRIILSAWNVGDLDKMALPPCHTFFQFYVNGGKLSCQLYQRSADVFLGVPFNIASYAMLTMMVAQVCNLELGDFVHTFGDAHIYSNHYEQCELQLTRKPYPLPTLKLNRDIKDINDFKITDFELIGYQHYPTIKGEMSI